MINKTAAAYIFPCLWAFCSPYTKNRTKPKPNKCGLFARLLQVFPASRQPQPIPTQNASRRQPFIFRRIQSQKGGYFKAVTIPKKHLIKLYNTAHNILCNILLSIFKFVLAFLVIMWYTLIKIKERHNDSEA